MNEWSMKKWTSVSLIPVTSVWYQIICPLQFWHITVMFIRKSPSPLASNVTLNSMFFPGSWPAERDVPGCHQQPAGLRRVPTPLLQWRDGGTTAGELWAGRSLKLGEREFHYFVAQVHPWKYAHGLHFMVWLFSPYPSGLLRWQLGNHDDYPSANEVTLKDMGTCFMWISYRGFPAKRALSAMCKHGG